MTVFPIVDIRSVELGTPDLAASESFYTGIWGLQLQDRVDGVVYLRASGRDHHVLSLQCAPRVRSIVRDLPHSFVRRPATRGGFHSECRRHVAPASRAKRRSRRRLCRHSSHAGRLHPAPRLRRLRCTRLVRLAGAFRCASRMSTSTAPTLKRPAPSFSGRSASASRTARR